MQQASESLHEEAWVGRVNSSNLKISQEVEINKGVWLNDEESLQDLKNGVTKTFWTWNWVD